MFWSLNHRRLIAVFDIYDGRRLHSNIYCISAVTYESLHYDKQRLRQISTLIGRLEIISDADLAQVRSDIDQLIESVSSRTDSVLPRVPKNWCFVDSTTAERFFRVDQAQEHLHYATDIFSEELFIVYPEANEEVRPPSSGVAVPQDRRRSHLLDSAAEKSLPSDVSGHRPLHRVNAKRTISSPARNAKLSEAMCGDIGGAMQNVTSPQKSLIAACHSGNVNKLADAVASGGDLMQIDRFGLSTLHHAAICGHAEIVAYILLNTSAELLNVVDRDKRHTALHKAAMHGNLKVCHLLVDAGTSLEVVDSEGKTAGELALMADHYDLADYLRQCSRSPSTALKLALETDI